MSDMSDYLENALGNAVLRNTAFTSPATVYVALYTSDPSDADVGTEVAAASYARQPITFSAPTTAGVFVNNADVLFPTAAQDWGTITHVGIRDGLTGGNLLYYKALVTPKATPIGSQFIIRAGELTVSHF
jgi:hypothetical protein